ncbi:MAG: ribonuclease P protein component [Sphingobacterium sp.]|uniref:ribonuclease P protein component n=1 Tax=Sphingobacterium sp. JB170 TaxID=1434842 RepID=UPI00211B1EA1|nr:ribonuclease P protein component [Sphingobacterium sp. JB170]
MKHTFKKEERLCSKRLIDRLFHDGSSFVVYPYRVVFKSFDPLAKEVPLQSILSVSKRRFKRAVDRNFIKRRMREAFRLQKYVLVEFLEEHSLHLLLALQYIGKGSDMPASTDLHLRMLTVIERLKDESSKLYLGKVD